MSRIVLYIILTAKINFVIYYFFSSMSKKTQSAGLYVKNQHTQDGNKNRTQTYNDTFLTFLPFLFSALKKLAVVGWLQQYSTSLALEQYCLQL